MALRNGQVDNKNNNHHHHHHHQERQPLLGATGREVSSNNTHQNLQDPESQSGREQKVEFEDHDEEDPRHWSQTWKYLQTLQIFIVAFICPMASSIVSPAITQIASNFKTSEQVALLSQTGFVCMLGIGPLFHAPMSETFGRRKVYLLNLLIFSLLQIPTALAPDLTTFVVFRTLAGFFGSVGVANGGGSISDLFETRERAPVLGVYLVAPLLGPTIGPFVGGVMVESLHWRWLFWLMLILAGLATVMTYFGLYETRATTILEARKQRLEKKDPDTDYYVEGVSDQSIGGKIASNSTRAVRILTTQPIVTTMSLYQALVFSSMYSLYAQYGAIFTSSPYNFNKAQVGLAALGPAVGFIVTAVFIVLYIDKLYQWLCSRNNGDGKPEYRLPLANIGAVFLPTSLFWFGWSIEKQFSWPVPVAATLLFGAAQVSIFNTVQTYYIDSFEKNAASALAAGAFLRSQLAGIIPLFVGKMFDRLGYGVGMSVFGILSLILMPAPMLFYLYGGQLREKFPFKP